MESNGLKAVDILRRAYTDRFREVAREKEEETERRAQAEATVVVRRLGVAVESLGSSVTVAVLSNRAREILVGEGLTVELVEEDGDDDEDDGEYYLVSFEPAEVQ